MYIFNVAVAVVTELNEITFHMLKASDMNFVYVQELYENIRNGDKCQNHVYDCQAWNFNPCHSKLILGNIQIWLYFLSFHETSMKQVVQILHRGIDMDPFLLHGKYHGCWCPGDIRSQGISSHGIDAVLSEYSGSSTSGVKPRRIDGNMFGQPSMDSQSRFSHGHYRDRVLGATCKVDLERPGGLSTDTDMCSCVYYSL